MASREVQAVLDYIEATGIPCRVTAILGTWKSPENPCSPHTAKSAHCAEGTDGKGLAVDYGGAQPGTSLESLAQMAAVYAAFMKVAPQLAELIHSGPGITTAVKNGKIVVGLKVYGSTTWAAHRNHVHVAVHKGTFLTPPVQPPAPPPATVHDFEEITVKQTMIHVALDKDGNGWATWQPGFGRDPIIVGCVQLGPFPPDDGYWTNQARVNLSAQPRDGAMLVVVRNGTPGEMVSAWISAA
jgi:hypothetical protein